MANTAISVKNSKKNLTKQEEAARKVAEEMVIQKPAKPPQPFYKLDKLELKIFKKIRSYNEYFSDGDSLPLTELARAFVKREAIEETFNQYTPLDAEYKEFMKAHKYWTDQIQLNMKLLKITIGDRYSMAYEMSKTIQSNMVVDENEAVVEETNPVLKLIDKY
ncbi:hypothetical protein [Ureibacillus aquaedulcis]|uniref:Terminase small subunit n=1 Tax=Ureibacillus aquaedulcis TaxID=3058421 RepID=A0ABT8GNL6_9BACL|nr:hypothetical protein [Ureibacillus sp. BA0131]MDN4492886.1 hypothetical protein [Ureibacillus sp. BA0131]